MSHRLYLPESRNTTSLSPGAQITLDRDQSHYLLRVLRLKTGAVLSCFNGQGQEWSAEVISADRRECRISLIELISEHLPTKAPLTLAIGWLKGAAMDLVVQKATELGADELVVLNTERSNVSLDDKRIAGKLQHWRGIAISASEQSGRLFVPDISQPVALSEYLATEHGGLRYALDLDSPLLDAGHTPSALTLLVGPEGGWSDPERRLLEDHEVPRRGLGTLTLRAETVPLVALTAVRHSWGWRKV